MNECDWTTVAAGGSPPSCADNVRAAWREMLRRRKISASAAPSAIASVASPLRLCPSQPMATADDLDAVMYWLQDAFDYLAMGRDSWSSNSMYRMHSVGLIN